jgi:hypothetical protein
MQHFGLYFTSEQAENARKNTHHEPFASAWTRLSEFHPLDLLTLTQINGLRYRLENDTAAGERAIDLLAQINIDDTPTINAIAGTVTLAQCIELVRDYPRFDPITFDSFAVQVERLNQEQPSAHYEQAWLNLLNLAAGIVLERPELFQQAIEVFKETIRNEVHPEGYIGKDVQYKDSTSALYRMLLSTQALILTAEAATHAGENLWAFEHRSVSAMTPTPYLLYYYYYPEKWRWDTGLQSEDVKTIYRSHAGFWEMAQRRTPSRDRKILLDELRPIYDTWGGGLTTLTHGGEIAVKRRGLFG